MAQGGQQEPASYPSSLQLKENGTLLVTGRYKSIGEPSRTGFIITETVCGGGGNITRPVSPYWLHQCMQDYVEETENSSDEVSKG